MSTNPDTTVPSGNLQEASRIISSAAGWSAAAGVIPLPLVDLAALAAVQVKMINDIGRLYGQSFGTDAVRSTVSVLLGTLVPGGLASVAASSAKTIPVTGTFIGMATLGAFGAASTYAIGKVLVRHFERGGTAAAFNPQSVAEELKQEFAAAQVKTKAA